MQAEQFVALLRQPENHLLDFKRDPYHFKGEGKKDRRASFIKDLVSFHNTIRSGPAYILIGVDDDANPVGIDTTEHRPVDDAHYQDIVKAAEADLNLYPQFFYSELEVEGKRFGVFEIPIPNVEEPVSFQGRVLVRKGSTNSAATAQEIDAIRQWLNRVTHQNLGRLLDVIQAYNNKQLEAKVRKFVEEKNLQPAEDLVQEAMQRDLALLEKQKKTTAAKAYSIGFLKEIQGDLQDAIAYYERALALAPDEFLYKRELAMAHYCAGDQEKAAKLLQELVAELGGTPEEIVSYLLEESNRTAGELRLGRAPKSVLQADLGSALVLRGEREQGTRLLEEALQGAMQEFGPTHPRTQTIQKALVIAKQGREEGP